MTKKDFIALADAIKDHNHEWQGSQQLFWSAHLDTLASFCKSQNHRFNRERWIGYINGENGPNGGAIKPKKEEL